MRPIAKPFSVVLALGLSGAPAFAARGGNVSRASARSSVNRSANVNRNTNINRNTNVNVNRDVGGSFRSLGPFRG